MAPIIGAISLQAGTLFYVPISASESDSNSGISSDNTYTSAVDGGNGHGTDRVINGITLYALTGEGQSLSANNCFLSALEGTIANGGGSSQTIQADGTMAEVASDMTFNNEANDGSKQEIVLDPASLTAGTTYDLRVYVCNSSGQNREVNLTVAGDSQQPVETGWFNEDDATTSAGGFQDANQVYYIDYRYTWDGDTTPGITVEQRYGRTPFCLYALTNQVVPGEETGAGATAEASPEAAPAAEEQPAAGEEEGGLTTGYVGATSDDVGVTSDTFYSDDSLNSNGEWVDVASYGKCWRPTRVSSSWRPYTNGHWGDCGECGWTWISDEDWGWCTYHYGRWCHTEETGWCWSPGTVWSPAWVSWRRGTGSDCSCVGWAPLPPEAGCAINVGVGSWVDYTCGIGPGAYTFVNVVDFGSDNFSTCGRCLIDRGRYVNIFQQTTNVTNISYVNVVNKTNNKYVNIYNGGPDRNWVNGQIRKQGGKEISQIHVNRYDDPARLKGGKHSQLEGNTLSLAAPKITATKNPQHVPKVAATIPKDKVDKGWNGIKDPKVKQDLQNKIAQQNRGQSPKSAPAKLPPNVASQLTKGRGAGAAGGAGAQLRNLPKGAVVQQPGSKRGQAGQNAGNKVPPGRPGQRNAQGGSAAGGKTGRPGAGDIDASHGLAATPKTQGGKPGQRVGQKGQTRTQALAGQGGMRPGQSLKKTGGAQEKLSAQKNAGQGNRQAGQGQGLQPGKPGVQGKGQNQAQQGKQGGNGPPPRVPGESTGEQGRGGQQGKAREAQSAKERNQGARQSQETGQTAQREAQANQQKQAQQQQLNAERERTAAAQKKEAQQQRIHQQQAQEKKQQQGEEQQQKQAEERRARQRQAQQQQAQQQQQQQEAAQRQRQLQQQQQAQQRQRQQQAQQQQLQQQRAQQQQRPPPRGKPTPTPTPR